MMNHHEEVAEAILSGSYERRRGYITNQATTWTRLAVMGTIAIWAYLVRWEALLGQDGPDNLFATQVAWAGALSSLLIGAWRYWARVMDNDIVRTYPAIYLSERLLLSKEICTISAPEGVDELPEGITNEQIEYRRVQNKHFGGRGHTAWDWIAVVMILFFGAIALSLSDLREPLVYLLLSLNIFSLMLIFYGFCWWRGESHNWPVAKVEDQNGRPSSHK